MRNLRKSAIMITITLACVLIFSGVASADTTTTLPQEFVSNFAKLLSFILQALSKIFLPIIMLTGALMKSDFIFSGTMNETLLTIWTQIRNLVNVIFAVMLIVVALYNVLGLGESAETGAYLQFKKALPKVVLGLILVNFSYLGVRVLIDVVNVGTTIAFSIPNSTGLPANVQKELKADQSLNAFCRIAASDKKLYGAIQKAPAPPKKGEEPKPKPVVAPSKEICDENQKLTKETLEMLTKWNIDGAVPIMAIKFMNLQKLDSVSAEIQKSGGKIEKLTLNLIVSIVLYLLYGVSFLALFVMLLGRAVALWMVVVFSPVIAIQMAFPQLISSVGGGNYGQQIIKTLIAPIIIGFVMSIGFMIIGTMQNVDYSNTSLNILSISTTAADLQTSNIETFQQFLIAIGAVAFVFLGVQSATKDAIGGEIAGSILSGAQQVGTWAATAPFKYAPIFPVQSPDGEHFNASPAAMLKVVGAIPDAMNTAANEQAKKMFPTAFGNFEAQLKEIKDGASAEKFADIVRGTSKPELLKSKELVSAAKRMMDKGGITDKNLKEQIEAIANSGGDEEKVSKAIERIRNLAKTGPVAAALDTKKTEVPQLVSQRLLEGEEQGKLERLQKALADGKIKTEEDLKNHEGYAASEKAKRISEAVAATTGAATGAVGAAKADPAKVTDALNKAKGELETAKVPKAKQKEILVKIVNDATKPEERTAIADALEKGQDAEIKAVGQEIRKTIPPTPPAEPTPVAVSKPVAPPVAPAAAPPKAEPPAAEPPKPGPAVTP